MEKRVCTQCGAVLGNNNKCEFCGCTYQNTAQSQSNRTDIQRLNDTDIGHVLKDVQLRSAAVIIITVFMCVWCGAAFFMGITSVSTGAPVIFVFMPFGMCAIGLVVLGVTLTKHLRGGTKQILKLWQDGRYEEALSMCETKNTDSYKIAWAVIAFHKYMRDDEAYQKLMLVSNDALYEASTKSTALSQLLKHFDIKVTAPVYNRSSTSIHFGNHHDHHHRH